MGRRPRLAGRLHRVGTSPAVPNLFGLGFSEVLDWNSQPNSHLGDLSIESSATSPRLQLPIVGLAWLGLRRSVVFASTAGHSLHGIGWFAKVRVDTVHLPDNWGSELLARDPKSSPVSSQCAFPAASGSVFAAPVPTRDLSVFGRQTQPRPNPPGPSTSGYHPTASCGWCLSLLPDC